MPSMCSRFFEGAKAYRHWQRRRQLKKQPCKLPQQQRQFDQQLLHLLLRPREQKQQQLLPVSRARLHVSSMWCQLHPVTRLPKQDVDAGTILAVRLGIFQFHFPNQDLDRQHAHGAKVACDFETNPEDACHICDGFPDPQSDLELKPSRALPHCSKAHFMSLSAHSWCLKARCSSKQWNSIRSGN